jgi:protein-S-isoprenylcysteine O-methyltransferase Ste14
MSKMGELPFRIVFGLLWLIYFVVRFYFQGKVKGVRNYSLVNEKQEKLFFRLFALAYLLLPLYFLTAWIDFAHLPLPLWLRWVGTIVTILGIGLFGWAHDTLGLNWTAILALSKEHELVMDGPYSAFFTIGLGFLLLSANWLIGVIYLGTLEAMYVARVSREEEMLVGRFGEAYKLYMQRTGRILPRLKI